MFTSKCGDVKYFRVTQSFVSQNGFGLCGAVVIVGLIWRFYCHGICFPHLIFVWYKLEAFMGNISRLFRAK